MIMSKENQAAVAATRARSTAASSTAPGHALRLPGVALLPPLPRPWWHRLRLRLRPVHLRGLRARVGHAAGAAARVADRARARLDAGSPGGLVFKGGAVTGTGCIYLGRSWNGCATVRLLRDVHGQRRRAAGVAGLECRQ